MSSMITHHFAIEYRHHEYQSAHLLFKDISCCFLHSNIHDYLLSISMNYLFNARNINSLRCIFHLLAQGC